MKNVKIFLTFLLVTTLFVAVKASAQPSIQVGVASMITPVSAVKYYQQVVEYIGRKLGIPAKMVHRTTYDEIDENDFNLNIPRYVDTFEEEAEVDITAVQKEIETLEGELKTVQKEMKKYLKELEF